MPARNHGQTEADGQRGENTDLQGPGRRVRLLGLHVRADVQTDDGASLYRRAAVEEKHPAHGREDPCDDGDLRNVARDHTDGGAVESRAARLGELLQSRYDPQRLSRARSVHGCAVTSVAATQAQAQAQTGRGLSTLAPVRAFWARPSNTAWPRPVMGDGVMFCPRAGCGRSASPVR